jgi:poly(A) polymerase
MDIVRRLRDAGHIAYFAGGCVRDELLAMMPEDYDVATDAHPQRVTALFPRAGEVGRAFGVVIVRARGEVIEVATFREEGPYSDQRRPDHVRFSTAQADARRRDYTINALFLDPFGKDNAGATTSPLGGTVIDFVGGLADLRARLLRAVGDPAKRLAEDHLRGLRAARLAARLALTIDLATAEAIRTHAAELRGVSRERVGDEIRRMLRHPSRTAAAVLIHDLGLEDPVFLTPPDMTPGKLGKEGPRHLAALSTDASTGAALAAWALDLGYDVDEGTVSRLTGLWRRALCLANEERDTLESVLRLVRTLRTHWDDLSVAARKRLAAGDCFADAVALLEAEDLPRASAIRHVADELAASPGGLAPEPLVTGSDLVALGLPPGPAYKRVLDQVYDAQLEGWVRDKAEALELARRLCV